MGTFVDFFITCLVLLVCTAVIVIAVQRRWYIHLQTKHPKVWSALGEPRLLGCSAAVQWRVLRFIQAGDYRDFNDVQLDRLTRKLRRWGVSYIVLFGLTVIVLLVGVLTL
ncbi:hypothetical protein [Solimonas marina]|uniref:Universal stress protein B n=1 Tax=Solimonas marina TaxID=2714601 RepID=A0A969W9S2_9GAMM|nr:hypothetical protein [Solimonas marina]NKF22083.1 hypothetical protein [Solimonas marina]